MSKCIHGSHLIYSASYTLKKLARHDFPCIMYDNSVQSCHCLQSICFNIMVQWYCIVIYPGGVKFLFGIHFSKNLTMQNKIIQYKNSWLYWVHYLLRLIILAAHHSRFTSSTILYPDYNGPLHFFHVRSTIPWCVLTSFRKITELCQLHSNPWKSL